MPSRLHLELDPDQRRELEAARDHHAFPYVRERAAALLKIAAGHSGLSVARTGLLRLRTAATVSEWYRRYRAGGLAGLLVKPGRGRKPAFSPSVPHRRPGH